MTFHTDFARSMKATSFQSSVDFSFILIECRMLNVKSHADRKSNSKSHFLNYWLHNWLHILLDSNKEEPFQYVSHVHMSPHCVIWPHFHCVYDSFIQHNKNTLCFFVVFFCLLPFGCWWLLLHNFFEPFIMSITINRFLPVRLNHYSLWNGCIFSNGFVFKTVVLAKCFFDSVFTDLIFCHR